MGTGNAMAAPTAKVMTQTQRMSDATLNSRQLGTYGRGNTLSLSCYKRGQSVKGYFSKYIAGGFDNLWYRTSDGGFVADVDIETRSNNPVTGPCAAAAPTAPAQQTQPASGGRSRGQTRTSNGFSAPQCTWGAENFWKAATGSFINVNGDAKDWATSARANGWTVTNDPQPRSLVVFVGGHRHMAGYDKIGNIYRGHVAWVESVERRADGLYVHGIETNYYKSPYAAHQFVEKHSAGMSYILAP
ncbi:CHAP domain-containing protein [Williamsia herbipolensis]|uniref:CHAP domain-containing protein n=1 Tax=Williamsia herbipolensis TaxID=1603258 RepID=UPI001364B06E|nr:CHAP domain-containing protein [Williamsia herbipolensis]